MIASLIFFGGLGGLILGGMALGRARDRAWRRAAEEKIPRAIRRLFVVGESPWIVIGRGKGMVFRDAAEVASVGFKLASENGETLLVPSGTVLFLTGFEEARRSDLPGTRLLPHWTFEVPTGQRIYLRETGVGESGAAPYRAGTRTLLPGDDGRLSLAGDPGALVAGLAPRFWLLALFLLAAGAGASELGPEAWAAACPAVLLTILGWAAMPAAPPAS
jgi:hypothetical protein